jgi:hypothetical protein
LTLWTSSHTTQAITVPSEIKVFDELRTGDRSTVHLFEAIIVAVRPGSKPSVPVGTTASATSCDQSGKSDVLQQVKAAVTVESVDRRQHVVVNRTGDNQRVTRAVVEPHLLDGLKTGNVVEITDTGERAVDLQRAR